MKSIKAILLIFIALLGLQLSAYANPQPEEEFNAGETIFHHLSNSHEWHLFSIGDTHVSIPLPVILYTPNGLDVFLSSEFHHGKVTEEGIMLERGKNTYIIEHDHIKLAGHAEAAVYDFSITKNVASMFLSVVLLFIIFGKVAKSYQTDKPQAPKGLAGLVEPVILFVRDEIAVPAIGKDKYERFMPYLLTVFFYIWINNLLGLLPGAANLTGNITITATLAGFTLVMILFNGNKNYWGHIFAPPVPTWLYPIMVPIEIVGIFTKPFALAIRLFANITAGHIVILSLLSLIFIFKSFAVAPISVGFALFINGLELLVAFIQAFVFTLLSALFIGQAVEEHHHEEHEAHHPAHEEANHAEKPAQAEIKEEVAVTA
ncbi:MAG: ATP synthase subunit a [Thermonema sp.]|uniref:F0F1 ATP synthase subunit A n=1 Tax=Thermonema sp. TaxID=2231181 RepID=UPI0021DE47B8|nr:F0F1 ATP synthase subunit A [Thermonema sp.]GIV40375.1 MAG: ATP synthase subunit a [Thermonema sp.]